MGSNRTIRSFEELEAWKACRDVRLFVANVVKQLPEEEKYRLRDQMIRASRSTTANIAEVRAVSLPREHTILPTGPRVAVRIVGSHDHRS